jgi:hypothetical protein
MSWDVFSDDCPGCRPAMVDLTTGQRIPEDAPMMKIVLGVWKRTTRDERLAFHRVTCQNSRTANDLLIVRNLSAEMQAALTAMNDGPQGT